MDIFRDLVRTRISAAGWIAVMVIFLGLSWKSIELVFETWKNSDVLTGLVAGFYFTKTCLNSCRGEKNDYSRKIFFLENYMWSPLIYFHSLNTNYHSNYTLLILNNICVALSYSYLYSEMLWQVWENPIFLNLKEVINSPVSASK